MNGFRLMSLGSEYGYATVDNAKTGWGKSFPPGSSKEMASRMSALKCGVDNCTLFVTIL